MIALGILGNLAICVSEVDKVISSEITEGGGQKDLDIRSKSRKKIVRLRSPC